MSVSAIGDVWNMDSKQLEKMLLEADIRPEAFSVAGRDCDECLRLERRRDGWVVYYAVREAEGPGELGLRDAHRAERPAALDDEARHDSDSDPGCRQAEDAVHLAALEGERRLEAGPATRGDRRRAQVVAVAEHHEWYTAQLGDRHAAALRERVRLRHGEHELLAQQRCRLEDVVVHRQDHQRDVEHALLQLTDQVARAGLVQHELDARIALVIAGERRRYERRGEARPRAD